MTVNELLNNSIHAVTLPHPEREIQGAYIGDLLSWVMGRASEGNIWITIMSNTNVIAVASLVNVSAVLLTEGVTLSQNIIDLATEKGINILATDLPSYEAALLLSETKA